jgi:drug/metabolite transporter (DMT)-like permease
VKFDRGILAALAAAALFGLSTPIAKMLLGTISPLLLAGLLYMGSGIGLAIVLTVRATSQGRANIVRPRGIDLLWLLGAIALGGAIGPYLLMYGLQMTDSAYASLILNVEGVFTALLAWSRLRRILIAELPQEWRSLSPAAWCYRWVQRFAPVASSGCLPLPAPVLRGRLTTT